MRGDKGITLIALVITIIIMLILAGVTISLVFNGGLINYAQNAKADTASAIDTENTLSQGKVKIGSDESAEVGIQNVVDNIME